MALFILVFLGLVAPVTAQTGNEEPICRTDANVFFCENYEDRAPGPQTSANSGPLYKNGGWGVANQGDPTSAYVTDQHFDGTRSHRFTIPADASGPGTDTLGPVPWGARRTVYVRWYERLSGNHIFANSNVSGSVGEKNFELNMLDFPSTGSNFFLASLEPTQPFSGACDFGCLAPPHHGTKDTNGQYNFFQNMNLPATRLTGDTWTCFEVRITMPSASSTGAPSTSTGSGDGIVEGWINDIQKWNYQNVQPFTAGTLITGILWAAYWNGFENITTPGAHPQQFKWLDNIIASTARIGCLGTAQQLPGTPTNLQITLSRMFLKFWAWIGTRPAYAGR